MKCKYPGCTISAKRAWAADVPLCNSHFDTIQTETLLYYNRGINRTAPGIEKGKRNHNSKIAHLTRWKHKEGVECDS